MTNDNEYPTPTPEEIFLFLLKCVFVIGLASIVILSLIAMITLGHQMVEYDHAQQAAAIANCTMYNANSTDGSFCLV